MLETGKSWPSKISRHDYEVKVNHWTVCEKLMFERR